MRRKSLSARTLAAFRVAIFLALSIGALARPGSAKVVGTVKAINGNSIILTTDSGTEMTVVLADSTRILQATPGQIDLKSAASIQAADIHVGDRILALGPNGEGNSTLVSTIVVMKQSDIANKQQQERDEWRRGVGGIVKEVDARAATIAVTNALASTGKPIVIHLSSTASIRRYPPDSVKFEDAKPGTLDQIKPGDQLRARGTKNVDGTEFTAQAIVSGTFRQIAGTVLSTDVAKGSVTVMDLLNKEPITLKVTADSQMHKLPAFAAQRLAMRIRGGGESTSGTPSGRSEGLSQGGAKGASVSGPGQGGQGNWRRQQAPDSAGTAAGPDGNSRGVGGAADFQQMLSRMPTISISDLQKGDAVMLVATEGTSTSAPNTITLLTGVDPILTAAPSTAVAATILSPWNLGASPGGGDAPPQ
jgi:hypothetical protein